MSLHALSALLTYEHTAMPTSGPRKMSSLTIGTGWAWHLSSAKVGWLPRQAIRLGGRAFHNEGQVGMTGSEASKHQALAFLLYRQLPEGSSARPLWVNG